MCPAMGCATVPPTTRDKLTGVGKPSFFKNPALRGSWESDTR
jgi:hypothetical protein